MCKRNNCGLLNHGLMVARDFYYLYPAAGQSFPALSVLRGAALLAGEKEDHLTRIGAARVLFQGKVVVSLYVAQRVCYRSCFPAAKHVMQPPEQVLILS